jgi:acetolactate synthase regulatory subunit
MVATYLEVSREDAEVWIVNLIRNANIEAKIDSERGVIVITNQIPNVYDKVAKTSGILIAEISLSSFLSLNKQQIMNKTRDLVPRTNILINNIKRFYSKAQ